MKFGIRTLYILIGIKLLVLNVLCSDLTLTAYCNKGFQYETSAPDVYKMPVVVALTNSGNHAIRVPTSGFGSLVVHVAGNTEDTLYFMGTKLNDGSLAIDPETRFSPVELLPGETTILHVDIQYFKTIDVAKIVVVYEVGADYGRRNKLWFGRLQTSTRTGSPFVPSQQMNPRANQ